jgi:hypothetical protein
VRQIARILLRAMIRIATRSLEIELKMIKLEFDPPYVIRASSVIYSILNIFSYSTLRICSSRCKKHCI